MQKINALADQAIIPGSNSIPQATPVNTNALELNDIHLPEPISNYPVAYGWWLLATLLTVIAIFSFIKLIKSIKRNQVKKQALEQLKSNPEMTISDTITLLKWAGMHYFSRAELAKLFGDSLQQYLCSKLPLKHREKFIQLSQQAFINQYNTSANTDEKLSQAAALWLTHALPPQTLKTKQGGKA